MKRFFCLLLGGCVASLTPEQVLPHTEKGVIQSAEADKVLAVGSPPSVKLIDPGEGSTDLSYRFVKGESSRVATSTSLFLKVGGTRSPTMHMNMISDTKVTDQNTAGEFRIETVVTVIGADLSGDSSDPLIQDALKQIAGMKGMRVTSTYWIDSKGHTHEVVS